MRVCVCKPQCVFAPPRPHSGGIKTIRSCLHKHPDQRHFLLPNWPWNLPPRPPRTFTALQKEEQASHSRQSRTQKSLPHCGRGTLRWSLWAKRRRFTSSRGSIIDWATLTKPWPLDFFLYLLSVWNEKLHFHAFMHDETKSVSNDKRCGHLRRSQKHQLTLLRGTCQTKDS